MDFEKILHTIVDPFLINPDSLMVRELPSERENCTTLLICAESEDIARLIGKKGAVANALRELINVPAKNDGKHVFLKFESFEEEIK